MSELCLEKRMHCQVYFLTRTLLDTEGSIGVFGPGVVLQLEGGGVVHEVLGALGHARPAVIEVGTGLQTEPKHGQRPGDTTRGWTGRPTM